jgi:hypothetical protein
MQVSFLVAGDGSGIFNVRDAGFVSVFPMRAAARNMIDLLGQAATERGRDRRNGMKQKLQLGLGIEGRGAAAKEKGGKLQQGSGGFDFGWGEG